MAVRVVLFKTTRNSSPPTSTSAAATDAVQHNAQPEQFKTTRLSNHEVFATFIGLSTVPQTVASIFSQVKQLNTSLFLCIRMGMGVVSTSYEYGWSGGCSPRRVQFGTSEQAAAGAAAAGACRVRPSPGLPGWRCRGLSSGLGRGAAPPGTRQVRRSGHRARREIADPHSAGVVQLTNKKHLIFTYFGPNRLTIGATRTHASRGVSALHRPRRRPAHSTS
jgi:hypothetical protein